MTYAVYTLPSLYQNIILKLPEKEREEIKRIVVQLTENPYVGDQLQIKFLREKRLREKRLYYLIFEDLKAVLIIAISDKKVQQKTIDSIISNINRYRKYLIDLLKKY
tara:strand:+ start:751 stop:1071 length:321 start_codon:yes stop_codon:yes gene_type:complete